MQKELWNCPKCGVRQSLKDGEKCWHCSGDKSLKMIPADENAISKKRDFCPCNHHFFIMDVTPVEEPLCEDGNFCPYCTEIKRLLDTIFSYEVRFDTNADDVDDELELDEYDEDMDADELLGLGEDIK